MNHAPDTADQRAQQAWAYALKVYARPGVSAACVLLQDELGLDVLVMLHLAHLAHLAHLTQDALAGEVQPINAQTVAAADDCVREWRDTVVRPLRAARRAIRKDDDSVKALRASVQQAELAAERHALAQLAALSLPAQAVSDATTLAGHSIVPIVQFYATRSARAELLVREDIAQAVSLLNHALFA